jgi:hypothetical protein
MAKMHEQHGLIASIATRSAHFDYLKPVYADTPFFVRLRILAREVIDDRQGLVRMRVQILDEANLVYSLARISEVVLRRPAV